MKTGITQKICTVPIPSPSSTSSRPPISTFNYESGRRELLKWKTETEARFKRKLSKEDVRNDQYIVALLKHVKMLKSMAHTPIYSDKIDVEGKAILGAKYAFVCEV